MSQEECMRHPVATAYECSTIKQHPGTLNSWAAVMTIADQPDQVIGTFDSKLEALRRATCAALIMDNNMSSSSEQDDGDREKEGVRVQEEKFMGSKSVIQGGGVDDDDDDDDDDDESPVGNLPLKKPFQNQNDDDRDLDFFVRRKSQKPPSRVSIHTQEGTSTIVNTAQAQGNTNPSKSSSRIFATSKENPVGTHITTNKSFEVSQEHEKSSNIDRRQTNRMYMMNVLAKDQPIKVTKDRTESFQINDHSVIDVTADDIDVNNLKSNVASMKTPTNNLNSFRTPTVDHEPQANIMSPKIDPQSALNSERNETIKGNIKPYLIPNTLDRSSSKTSINSNPNLVGKSMEGALSTKNVTTTSNTVTNPVLKSAEVVNTATASSADQSYTQMPLKASSTKTHGLQKEIKNQPYIQNTNHVSNEEEKSNPVSSSSKSNTASKPPMTAPSTNSKSNAQQPPMPLLRGPVSPDTPFEVVPNSNPCQMSHPQTHKVIDVFYSCYQAQRETSISRYTLGQLCRSGGGIYNAKHWRYLTKVEFTKLLKKASQGKRNYSIHKSPQFKQILTHCLQYAHQHGYDINGNDGLSKSRSPSPQKQLKRKHSSNSTSSSSPKSSSAKSSKLQDDDFDSTSLLPLHPQKVTKRVKKYVELVENKTNEVLVCFRGNLDAGRALGFDRKKVGRACQSYGAPFEIKFKGYHLRYKKAGKPLVAYEYGKHREDFMHIDETHEERMERWKKTFQKDLVNPPVYPFQITNPKGGILSGAQNPDTILSPPTHLETTNGANMNENESVDASIDRQEGNLSVPSPEDELIDVTGDQQKPSYLSEDGPTLKDPTIPPDQMNVEVGKEEAAGSILNDSNAVIPVSHRQELNVTYAPNEVAIVNVIEEDGTTNTNNGMSLYSRSATSLHPSTPVTLQSPSTNSDFHQLCIICQSSKAQVIFHPCHHSVLCAKCNSEGHFCPKFCPSCRTEIKDRVVAQFATYIRPRIYSAYSFM